MECLLPSYFCPPVSGQKPTVRYRFWLLPKLKIDRAMAKIGYTRKPDGHNRVPPFTLVRGAILLANARPDPTLAEIETDPPVSCHSFPHRLPDFDHTYPIMAGLFDQQPTRTRVITSSRDAASHFCGRRGRACSRSFTLLCSLYVMRLPLTRVTKCYLLALGTTQISSYFTKH